MSTVKQAMLDARAAYCAGGKMISLREAEFFAAGFDAAHRLAHTGGTVEAEPVGWMYEHPEGHINLSRREMHHTYEGWLARPVYAHPSPAPAKPTEARIAELEAALRMLRDFGCPVCSGDCASANPPVTSCPMQIVSTTLAGART